jgi:hypothetical protein
MATERQIEANRKNALLSTGPKTEEGKAIVSGNAIKHGILTNRVFVQEKSQEEFERLREGFYFDFQPKGDLETFLLERVISCAWRLALITQVESEMYDAEFSYGRIKAVFEGYTSDNMIILARYENAIERNFYRALAAFKQAQLNRQESIMEIGFVS